MPKASRDTAPERMKIDGFDAAYAALEGGTTVGFEAYDADADPAQLFRGLPDDRCQCPHWGYVLEGSMTFRYADRDETYRAGDAYYAPPGHLPLVSAGTRVVEFSPTEELGKTVAVLTQNMVAAGLV